MDTEPEDSRPSPEIAGVSVLAGLEDLADDDDASAAPPVLPPVVAVVVTDGGPGLEATLASLAEQEYPSFSTLVIDRGAPDDPTARVASVYPRAFVRRLS